MHENYIRDAIEGFLMQKTTFRVEILIHDDASTDKTASIVKEYEEQHPGLIYGTYQVENQYQKRIKTENYIKPHPRRGKYIASCEGDDYWTDPFKLQKQIDFLEGNKEYSLCTHDYILKYEHKDIPDQLRSDSLSYLKKRKIKNNNAFRVTLQDFCKHLAGIHTATIVYRKDLLTNKPKPRKKIISGDYVRNIALLKKGDGAFLPDTMSVLRKNPGGITQQKKGGRENFEIVSEKFFFLANIVPGKNKLYFYVRLNKAYIKMVLGNELYKMPWVKRLKYIPSWFYHTYGIFVSLFI